MEKSYSNNKKRRGRRRGGIVAKISPSSFS
jgi:hypothetical protein